MGEFSQLEVHDGWGEIVLDRPSRRNSLIPALAGEITDSLAALQQDASVQSIIIRGAEGYFCSGIDLKALQAGASESNEQKPGDVRSMHLALYHCNKPVIGALEGFAINAGAALAMACDLLIGGETAFFQIGEIQQGAGIPMNAAWLAIKADETIAARLAFIGDRVTTPELVRLGLATESVADDQVVTRCREIAARIAGFPEGASSTIKQALIDQRDIADPEAFFKSPPNNALLSAAMVKD